jgi:hypothetical protein
MCPNLQKSKFLTLEMPFISFPTKGTKINIYLPVDIKIVLSDIKLINFSKTWTRTRVWFFKHNLTPKLAQTPIFTHKQELSK